MSPGRTNGCWTSMMGGCVVCDGGEFSLVLEVATVSNLFTLEDLKIEGERDDSLGGAGGQLQCPHSVGVY